LISVVMPYWCRQEATDKALDTLEQYGNHIEVVIVDDGSPEPFQITKVRPYEVRVIRMPSKGVAKNPCIPLNVGVRAALNDVIVLTNPEILHTEAVLLMMECELKRLGGFGYVLSAAKCPESGEWHCHSTLKHPDLPEGVGHHFCAMLNRTLWDACGGFDIAYRDGQAWDDTDFALRLVRAGAKFSILDDVVVLHPKSGATTEWPAGGWQKNRDLFLLKWKTPVNICCVQAGNYQGRGAEYVNNLHDMVLRNMPPQTPFRFICFTDNAEGLDAGIDVRPLPESGLEGWWNKLALFKPDVFPDGERVIYFDLDTLIIGALDPVLQYSGEFAALRDFYRPDGLGSGVMMWEAGHYVSAIWESWEIDKRPLLDGGDQTAIEKYIGLAADRLQDVLPNKFVSYKVDCLPYPPQDAAVVCFHGEPRPHNCTQKWVADVWKVGGASALNLTVAPNTNNDVVLRNVMANANNGKWVVRAPAHEDSALICGSAPSLLDTLDYLRAYKGTIFALNNAAKVLAENGITADFQVLLDPRPENVSFVEKQYAKAYLLASQCATEVFDAVKGREVYIWHASIDGLAELFQQHQNLTLIGGGTTVGLSAMCLAYTMGFRRLGLFGYDSSYRDDKGHAAPQRRTEIESWTFDVTVGDRTFKSNAAMAKQAEIFPMVAKNLADLDCEIYVFGDGLLPYIAHNLTT
jgi:hypothetical protein